jgi:hypothetical protein
MDVIEMEGMMETFAAIVVAAVVVLLVVLGILQMCTGEPVYMRPLTVLATRKL